ncbi:MAG: Trx7/PDZ domain-containing (seleno)protein [Planctomycetota bacterium]
MQSLSPSLFTAVWMLVVCTAATPADDLRERLKDDNGRNSDVWVYNDIPAAMAAAKRTGKPLFVTFRCVPCRDCAAFDADVANGNERVREFAANRFISVRQVEMKNVDLTQFQFDYDLNWAALFLNADGTVYARYGTQSAEGSDAYNSIDGLLATMHRVLELHSQYPANRRELSDKRGKPRAVSDALQHPGLRNPAKYAQQTTRSNCIHCHNIHDAEHFHALRQGQWNPALLWKYPLPDQLGLQIDRTSGIRISSVTPGSAAATAGLAPGEDILRVNGQRITSIADFQWALHEVPDDNALITVQTTQTGPRQLRPASGWRQSDFSWRGSMWNAPPRLQVWLPELTPDQSAKLGLPAGDSALEVRWINLEGPGGRQAQADGLREKDIVTELDGKPIRMNSRQFNAHLKLHYRVGDRLPLTVLRDGRRLQLSLLLVE